VIALADELAGAAAIVTRKTARTPVAIVRGRQSGRVRVGPDAGARGRPRIVRCASLNVSHSSYAW